MNFFRASSLIIAFGALLVGSSEPAIAQATTTPPSPRPPLVVPDPVLGAKPVVAERIKVHGASLEGNLEGDSPDREVIVYLPPSYATSGARRYPVLYALHGYSISNEKWTTEIKTPQTIEGAFATGTREMIVVLANAQTKHNGSMYSNSVTTGNWEDFMAHDLVAYIDTHYRTIRGARAAGSPATRWAGTARCASRCATRRVLRVLRDEPLLHVGTDRAERRDGEEDRGGGAGGNVGGTGFMTRATLASAAAWSPNPKAPPSYVDLPTKDGVAQPTVLARWAANAPLAMVDQYVANLRRYKAIALDVGDMDRLKDDTAELHRILDAYGIANGFDLYHGDHVSNVADRMQNHVLPFFGRVLEGAERDK